MTVKLFFSTSQIRLAMETRLGETLRLSSVYRNYARISKFIHVQKPTAENLLLTTRLNVTIVLTKQELELSMFSGISRL
jgi:hypothetical protein